jgi:transcriptional regulator with XRE-family HTH domain
VTRNSRLIGDFLKARRPQLVRADLGLPSIRRGKSIGLRREEVACLAGVSVTWYTWLEQGRDIAPSRQVLDALARTLRLTAPEHAYLLLLAGYSAPSPSIEPIPQSSPAHVQQLLEAFGGVPAYVIASHWGVSGWNPTYAALYPNVANVPAADRNLLWLLFTDPYLRELLSDWELTCRSNVAAFRAGAGTRISSPPFSDLVTRLLAVSEAFRIIWGSHHIDPLASRQRLFRHPIVGDLHLEQHSFTPSDHPDLHVVIYTPALASDACAQLHQLSHLHQPVEVSAARSSAHLMIDS